MILYDQGICKITLYSLNKDDDTHIPNLIAMNQKWKTQFIAFFYAIKTVIKQKTIDNNYPKNLLNTL